jgi:hypothetical protein
VCHDEIVIMRSNRIGGDEMDRRKRRNKKPVRVYKTRTDSVPEIKRGLEYYCTLSAE